MITSCIELDFLEPEVSFELARKLGIRLHLAELSLSDIISILENLGVDRHRTIVHRWVQKTNLQPADGANPNHVAVDETAIQLVLSDISVILSSILTQIACSLFFCV